MLGCLRKEEMILKDAYSSFNKASVTDFRPIGIFEKGREEDPIE